MKEFTKENIQKTNQQQLNAVHMFNINKVDSKMWLTKSRPRDYKLAGKL